MWRNWHRKGLLLAAGILALAFAGGIATHTAYAKLKGDNLALGSFHISFGGVTDPLGELEDGTFDVRLFAHKFMRDRNPYMTVTLFKKGGMIAITDQVICDDGTTGWCISSSNDSWVFHPQFFNPAIPVDADTTILWGPGTLEQLDGSKAGMANFKVRIDVPANPEDGVQVVVDIEGFASKMKNASGEAGEDSEGEYDDDEEEGQDQD
jgi:hypothetical protein